MKDRIQSLVDECKRQEESCLYTSTTLYEWLKGLQFRQRTLIIMNIGLGAISASQLLIEYVKMSFLINICGLLAGILPAVCKALNFDENLDSVKRSAAKFKIIQDRFRLLPSIIIANDFEKFHEKFEKLMESMNDERTNAPIVPERFFKKARKKIDKGHYNFRIDENLSNQNN